MKKMTGMVAAVAAVAALGSLAGCQADPSAPTRPRTQLNPLTPDEKAKENADKRAIEAPDREYPTSGKEFPGQSRAAPADGATVVTADAGKPPKGNAHGPTPLNGSDSVLPETRYNRDYYPGPLPHLPANPGTTPMAGATQVPGTNWAIDHSWGQVLVLTDYPHRDWAPTQATYVAATSKNNPEFYFNIQDRLPVAQNTGTYLSNWEANLYEVPWFYAQTLALPVLVFQQFAPGAAEFGSYRQTLDLPLMVCLQGPYAQVTTQRLGSDPNYFSCLPAAGLIVPAPTEGVIKWEYPFLTTTGQDVTTMPASPPIASTPGMAPVPEAGAPGPVVPVEPPSPTPGLK